MECSLHSVLSESSETVSSSNGLATDKSDKRTKSGLRVKFTEKDKVKERREKFLTAKYGSHQMSLIRKRLAVELWLYEKIQLLCMVAEVTNDVEVDIDELLDLDNDDERRQRIKEQMTDIAEKFPGNFEKFSEELLEKMSTL